MDLVSVADPMELVRRGYNRVAERYDEAFPPAEKYERLITDLLARLPTGSTVLDLGCGSGVPVARALVEAGHQVLGVDFSEIQIARAR